MPTDGPRPTDDPQVPPMSAQGGLGPHQSDVRPEAMAHGRQDLPRLGSAAAGPGPAPDQGKKDEEDAAPPSRGDPDADPSPRPFEGLGAEHFFDAFPNPLMLIDEGRRLRACNPECAILLGRPADLLRGRPLDEVVALATETYADPVAAAWEQNRPIKDIPGVITLDKARLHVVVSATKIGLEDGSTALLVVLKNASREQAIIRAIREVAKRAARTADGLSTMGEGTSRKVDEIRSSMGEIADGTQIQAEKVEETVDIIKDLARSIDSINNHATEAAQKAVAVAQNAREGTDVAGRALERLSGIIAGVESSGHLVQELSEHIEEVETIIDFIREISQKTNMLALNAAIEAARAGEHGKAFGVVADEVKRLSDHTRDSIRKVGGIIGEVKEDTHEVVNAIQARTQEVKDSAEVVKSALHQFEGVAGDIMESSGLVESISQKTTEQKRGAGAIVAAIDEVAAVAEEASTNTELTSRLAIEMAESVEALTAATQELTGIATSLHNTLDRYFQHPRSDEGPWAEEVAEAVQDVARRAARHENDPLAWVDDAEPGDGGDSPA